MKHSELVERVAKSICDGNWNAVDFNSTPNGEEPEELRDYWRDIATGAIAEIVKAVQEPTPKMCDAMLHQGDWSVSRMIRYHKGAHAFWQAMLSASPLAPEVET